MKRKVLPVLLLALITALAACARAELPPAPEGTFSVVAIGDTQNYAATSPETFEAITRWIVDNREAQRIVFVTHQGDIVDRADSREQWENARRAMDTLHGVVPYGLSVGNHDMNGRTGAKPLYEEFFGRERFEGFEWYGGSPDNNGNSFQLISAEGVDLIFVHLECNAPDDVLAWASNVLTAHADRRAVITTHMYLGPVERPTDNAGYFTDPKGRMRWSKCHGERGNTPQQIWEKLISHHPNVILVLSGDQSRTQAMRLQSVGIHGNTVHELMCDIRQGYIRVMRFVPAEDRIEVRTYSPTLGQLCAGTRYVPDIAQHQFSLECDLTGPIPTAEAR